MIWHCCRVLRDVARAKRLSPEDQQDFIQAAQVKLLERRYDVFRRFQGRSSLQTYLTVVATRLLLDWRNSVYGKWRPSAAAISLGEDAVRLERLVARDGYNIDEAVSTLVARRAGPSKAELLRLADRLPHRPRRRMLSQHPMVTSRAIARFEDPVGVAERRAHYERLRSVLASALKQLPPEDRRLIRLRYGQNRSVPALATALKADPKKLYRRFDQALKVLRHSLLTAGVTGLGEIAGVQ